MTRSLVFAIAAAALATPATVEAQSQAPASQQSWDATIVSPGPTMTERMAPGIGRGPVAPRPGAPTIPAQPAPIGSGWSTHLSGPGTTPREANDDLWFADGAPGAATGHYGEREVPVRSGSAPTKAGIEFSGPMVTAPPEPKSSATKWSPIITGAIGSTLIGKKTAVQGTGPRLVAGDPKAAPPGAAGGADGEKDPAPAGDPKADPKATATAPAGTDPKPRLLESLPPDASPAEQYCFNTGDAAAEARVAWQAKRIGELEAELVKKAAALETKTTEYKAWLAKRDEFARKAQDKLVSVYAKMRPDAAALQLSALEDDIAAALITKLDTKVASAVMNEMEPERAAKLATIISGAGKLPGAKPLSGLDGKKREAETQKAPAPAAPSEGKS